MVSWFQINYSGCILQAVASLESQITTLQQASEQQATALQAALEAAKQGLSSEGEANWKLRQEIEKAKAMMEQMDKDSTAAQVWALT